MFETGMRWLDRQDLDLDASIAELFGSSSTNHSFAAQDDIRNEKAVDDRLHLLTGGWAAQYRLLDDGRRQLTTIYLAGDLCDLNCVFLGACRSNVVALTRCETVSVPLAEVEQRIESDPDLRRTLQRALATENEALIEQCVCLGQRSAVERLAHLFCELRYRLDRRAATKDGSVAFPLIQAQLADLLGLSYVTINRTLQELRREGMLSLDHRSLSILDWDRLIALCGFRPDRIVPFRAGPPMDRDSRRSSSPPPDEARIQAAG